MKKEKDRLSIITLAVAKSYTNKAISALSEVVRYIGVTTTEISDGSTTNPITIDGSSVTAVAGDTVFYEGSAYTFDGTKWQETISFAEVITDIETINGEIGDLTALTTLVKSSIVAAINELNEKKTNLSVVAALFDASVSYAVGDYCTKDGLFYKCTTAHTEAWDANDFQAVTVGNEIDANTTDINGIKNGATINNFAGVETALADKVDKVQGKGLSTNDYTDADKTIVGGVTTALAGKVDKVEGKGLSENDYTDSDKAIVGGVTAALALKQDATDNNLTTTSKQVVGAVNELNSNLTNLQDWTSADTKTVTGKPITLTDSANLNAKALSMSIEPIQDLHGFDHPWVGGAGKALFAFKEVTQNTGGVDVTTIKDDAGNILGYNLNGTATQDIDIWLKDTNIMSGNLPSGITRYFTTGLTSEIEKLQLVVAPGYFAVKTNKVDSSEVANLYINILSGCVLNNVKIYPMICLDSETDKSFAPYTNICPISGLTEASVVDNGNDVWIGNNEYTIASSGHIVPNTSIALSAGTYSFEFDMNTPVGDFELEVFKGNSVEWTNRLFDRVFHSNSHNAVEFTINESATNLRLWSTSNTGAAISNVRLYSTKHTTTITFGQTVYGGTVNFNTGKVTVDRAIVDLGDFTWTTSSGGTDGRYETTAAITGAVNPPNNATKADMSCSNYEVRKYWDSDSQGSYDVNGSLAIVPSASNKIFVHDNNLDGMTGTEVKTAISGVQVCYELATPTELTLTPSQLELLKGNNTITANGATISLTYQPDNLVGEVMEQVQPQIDGLQEQIDEILIPFNYSTTEQKTGQKWLDNDVYARIIVFDTPAELQQFTWYATDMSSSDISYILRCDGINADGTYFPLASSFADSDYVRIMSYKSGQTRIKYATVFYTKATT